MADAFDLIVIGAGPGGYVTAIRAAFSTGQGTFIPAGYLAGLGVTALFAALMFGISVRLVAQRSRRN